MQPKHTTFGSHQLVGEHPAWCQLTAKLQWWSESQKKHLPVRPSGCERQDGEIVPLKKIEPFVYNDDMCNYYDSLGPFWGMLLKRFSLGELLIWCLFTAIL
jgi:hypothetical protein